MELSASTIFLLLTFELINSLPLYLESNQGQKTTSLVSRLKREANVAFGKNYLTNYGYMSPGALHSEKDVAEIVSWSEALVDFQRFFGLSETGELDDATMRLMKKPRCGNHDKMPTDSNNLRRKKRYVKVGSKWQTNGVTYSINNYTPKLGERQTHEAIDGAFAVWEKHIPMKFRKISHKDNPDIVTFFAEGYHNDNTAFDGKGGFLAHAYYPGTGIGGDTHFDGAEPWTLHEKPYSGNDLFLVAVHELGHALGLGHSQNADAIMAPIYKHHNTKNFELPRDDIFGIQSIYGERYERPYNPIIPPTTHPTSPVQPVHPNWPRKPHNPPHTPIPPISTTTEPPPPDICELTHYDAVSFLRRELYVFSGAYMWRRQLHDAFMQGPYKITSFWSQLSDGVDAVYEDPASNKIVFFKDVPALNSSCNGKSDQKIISKFGLLTESSGEKIKTDHLYWEYDGISLIRNFPRPVRFLGLQNQHIGAAVWWERTGKSYFFQGSHYWRFTGTKVELNYPKSMGVWEGIPNSVDAAFTGVDTKGKNYTYFVKGTQYWTFNNKEIKAEGPPKSFRQDWLKCSSTKAKAEESIPSVAGIVLPIIFSFLLVAVLGYVIWKRRQSVNEKPVRTLTTIKKPPRPPSYKAACTEFPQPASNQHYSSHKTLFVSTAERKLRWFKFSLQGQV